MFTGLSIFWATFWGNFFSTVAALVVTVPFALWYEAYLDEERDQRHSKDKHE